MKILKAFRFRLKINARQGAILRQYAGSTRFAYNKALALQKERYEKGLKKLTYPQMAQELVLWKKGEETAFLREAPAQILQQKLMDLDKAYKGFFQKRAGFPKFKKRGLQDSFRFPDAQQMTLDQGGSRIRVPKLGWLPYHNSQEVIGDIKNATISLKGNHWYISIQTERHVQDPIHLSKTSVGIDMGITQFVTVSDGQVFPSIHALRHHQFRLRKEQRRLSRKTKGSSNWKKQRMKLNRVHQKVSQTRQDSLHKITTQLSKNHAIIVIEDLKVSNMSRSASGNKDLPGKNVRAKSGLNRSILDQGWFEFKRQLIYKQLWNGGKVVVVSPHYTSQRCRCCSHVSRDNRRSQSDFACVSCGHKENADLNAAKNIKAAGHAVLACGEDVRPDLAFNARSMAASAKQEPPMRDKAVA